MIDCKNIPSFSICNTFSGFASGYVRKAATRFTPSIAYNGIIVASYLYSYVKYILYVYIIVCHFDVVTCTCILYAETYSGKEIDEHWEEAKRNLENAIERHGHEKADDTKLVVEIVAVHRHID